LSLACHHAAITGQPLVKHVLSREMQTYYEKITSAVLRPDPGVRRIAYGSLRADPGLHQLVPYLVQFVADKVRGHARGKTEKEGQMPKIDVLPLRLHVFSTDQVTKHLKDVDVLSSLMAMVRALTDNPNLFLEPYVRQLPYGYYGVQKDVLNHEGHSFLLVPE